MHFLHHKKGDYAPDFKVPYLHHNAQERWKQVHRGFFCVKQPLTRREYGIGPELKHVFVQRSQALAQGSEHPELGAQVGFGACQLRQGPVEQQRWRGTFNLMSGY